MKVLHIIDRLNVGGAEQMCVNLACIFSMHGHQVCVMELLTHGELGSKLSESIRRVELGRRVRWDLNAFLKLVSILREYDVVHIHMRHVYRYVALGNLFVGRRLIFHDHFNFFPPSGIGVTLLRILLKNQVYVSVDKKGQQWSTDILRIDPQNSFLMSNIILRDEVANEEIERSGIVMVSNLKKEKNILFAISLMDHITRKFPQLKLDIIGRILDTSYYRELCEKIEELDLNESIRFLTNVSDVQKELRRYALGIHTSELESGPLVLLEYIGQGLPFVSYYTGEISRRLAADVPNFFVNDFNIETWINSIGQLLSAPRQGSFIEELFQRHNNTEEYYQKWLGIYHARSY